MNVLLLMYIVGFMTTYGIGVIVASDDVHTKEFVKASFGLIGLVPVINLFMFASVIVFIMLFIVTFVVSVVTDVLINK